LIQISAFKNFNIDTTRQFFAIQISKYRRHLSSSGASDVEIEKASVVVPFLVFFSRTPSAFIVHPALSRRALAFGHKIVIVVGAMMLKRIAGEFPIKR
jgi:hypothetical protein